MENIATDKQYPKLSKASSGYLEIEHFKNADAQMRRKPVNRIKRREDRDGKNR